MLHFLCGVRSSKTVGVGVFEPRLNFVVAACLKQIPSQRRWRIRRRMIDNPISVFCWLVAVFVACAVAVLAKAKHLTSRSRP
jgi:hypothetical protein